jgi:hypothetical protein
VLAIEEHQVVRQTQATQGALTNPLCFIPIGSAPAKPDVRALREIAEVYKFNTTAWSILDCIFSMRAARSDIYGWMQEPALTLYRVPGLQINHSFQLAFLRC